MSKKQQDQQDQQEKSPYGAGFVAACIVVGAVLICGLTILFLGGGSSSRASSAAGQQPLSAAAAAQGRGGSGPAGQAGDGSAPATQATDGSAPAGQATEGSDSVGPAGVDSGSAPATPVDGPSQTGSSGRGASACSLPAGDQAVPASAPTPDSWEVNRRIVVPRSARFGPAVTDSDGFRHCFAHSPTGAVYAAYNAIAAIADQTKLLPTIRKLMVPGSDRDSLIGEVSIEKPSTDGSTVQLVGYRILDAGRDRVTVMLAMPVESVYMSANLTLVWYQGDWRIQPPQPGEAVGAPFAQHRDLSDFVKWSGI